jgi:hypothetical protein
MSRTVTVLLIYHRHKPIDSINLLGSQWRPNIFLGTYGKPIISLIKIVSHLCTKTVDGLIYIATGSTNRQQEILLI